MRRMRKRIADIIGRWQARRIRTKKINDLYRTIDENQAKLDKGGSL